jgi:negative regulator of sigma E activity
MSEQIREQVSAFLDGELPDTETELLLKRLTRDGELRESFGRYALIGEAVRGAGSQILTRGFASRVNLAIDGEPAQAPAHAQPANVSRWWRPLAGVTVAAGVAAVAILALQQAHHGPECDSPAENSREQSNAHSGRRRAARGALVYGTGDFDRRTVCADTHALDELCLRTQQVLLRPGPAGSTRGLADRGR